MYTKYRLCAAIAVGMYSSLFNDNYTRLFQCISLCPSPTVNAIINLIQKHIDAVMSAYHLPIYYKVRC